MTYNELNFPSFKIALKLWQSGILKKWKPGDDWEWWWICPDTYYSYPVLYSKSDLNVYFPDRRSWEFYAIPCPSLGEMMERLAERGFCVYRNINGDWSIGTFFLNNSIPMITKNTAANAAAKGVLEVEK